MNDLISQIVARCDALTAGQLFDDPAEGAALPVAVYAHALPIAETPEDHAEQVPSVVVRLIGLEESNNKINPLVRVIGEIYTAGGVTDGMADLLRLVDCLRPLVERGPGNLAGYKIIPPVVWQLGDKDAGNQPHPFYQFQADLRIAGV
jgi:hypothetical protein